jgi:hypothetical protein
MSLPDTAEYWDDIKHRHRISPKNPGACRVCPICFKTVGTIKWGKKHIKEIHPEIIVLPYIPMKSELNENNLS